MPTQKPQRQAAPKTRRELEIRAQALAGQRIDALARVLNLPLPPSSRNGKGYVGQLLERALGANPLAGERPDFPHLAVELKTVPISDRGRPMESTFCCAINMAHADYAQWETSRLRQRLGCVLWMPVHSPKGAPVGERVVGHARLWEPSAASWDLLRADWEDLMGAIGAGRAGTLTAREGRVLQVRPKAAHARVRSLAPGADGPEHALPLGFYLRRVFTARVMDGSWT